MKPNQKKKDTNFTKIFWPAKESVDQLKDTNLVGHMSAQYDFFIIAGIET